MNKYQKTGVAGLMVIVMLGTAGCAKKQEESSAGFNPKLDTQASVVLNTAGFFGNFEALDQVVNDFNQYYPNVEFTYEQVGSDTYCDYMDANPGVDILMSSPEMFEKYGDKMDEFCVDLSKADIDLGAIDENMLVSSYHNGKLSAIPMGQNIYGMIVNVSLLEKEGLSVPTNYDEFINVLTALKEKGYTPIQGPNSKVYAELTQNMLFDIILNDQSVYDDLMAGKESVVDTLLPVCDKLDEIVDQGFIDSTVNETYPNDNYDQAILKFFEGDVPFWVCNTEKVSGMKKRESKSEAFTANPFEYTYIYAPLGENGAYAYKEAWFGFSVNQESDAYEYAIEFIRFLATSDEINKMASIKGIPSVAVKNTDADIYKNILNPGNTEMNCLNEGKITYKMTSDWYTCVNKYMSGELTTGKEAMSYFVKLCSGQAES